MSFNNLNLFKRNEHKEEYQIRKANENFFFKIEDKK